MTSSVSAGRTAIGRSVRLGSAIEYMLPRYVVLLAADPPFGVGVASQFVNERGGGFLFLLDIGGNGPGGVKDATRLEVTHSRRSSGTRAASGSLTPWGPRGRRGKPCQPRDLLRFELVQESRGLNVRVQVLHGCALRGHNVDHNVRGVGRHLGPQPAYATPLLRRVQRQTQSARNFENADISGKSRKTEHKKAL